MAGLRARLIHVPICTSPATSATRMGLIPSVTGLCMVHPARWRLRSGRNQQMKPLSGDADVRRLASHEVQSVGFDTIGEDHTILAHLRGHLEAFILIEEAEVQVDV